MLGLWLSWVWAGVPIQLPPSEAPAAWRDALELAGLEWGGPGARLAVRVEGRQWVIEALAADGSVRSLQVAPPSTPGDREAIAFLARGLARELRLERDPRELWALGAPPPPPGSDEGETSDVPEEGDGVHATDSGGSTGDDDRVATDSGGSTGDDGTAGTDSGGSSGNDGTVATDSVESTGEDDGAGTDSVESTGENDGAGTDSVESTNEDDGTGTDSVESTGDDGTAVTDAGGSSGDDEAEADTLDLSPDGVVELDDTDEGRRTFGRRLRAIQVAPVALAVGAGLRGEVSAPLFALELRGYRQDRWALDLKVGWAGWQELVFSSSTLFRRMWSFQLGVHGAVAVGPLWARVGVGVVQRHYQQQFLPIDNRTVPLNTLALELPGRVGRFEVFGRLGVEIDLTPTTLYDETGRSKQLLPLQVGAVVGVRTTGPRSDPAAFSRRGDPMRRLATRER